MVQNADDSRYDKVLAFGEKPFLRFTITPKSLIAETNEDGFTLKNVRAICATGESSKKISASDDHIGEKGYGFKSVFAVADSVHVQSGIWTFRFAHQQGDDGLGMVTPLEAPANVLNEDVTTRITLHLAKSGVVDYLKLLRAVTDMPITTIFFLRRIRIIQFNVTDIAGSTSTTTIKRIGSRSRNTIKISRCYQSTDSNSSDTNSYECVSHPVRSMPVDERRKCKSTVKVELAFPVDPHSRLPKVDDLGQHVFAFLPVNRASHIPVSFLNYPILCWESDQRF